MIPTPEQIIKIHNNEIKKHGGEFIERTQLSHRKRIGKYKRRWYSKRVNFLGGLLWYMKIVKEGIVLGPKK